MGNTELELPVYSLHSFVAKIQNCTHTHTQMQWSNYENNMAIDESATTVFPNLIK